MALLPHDILREIGKYWAGHRMLYTCRALYASWDYTDYLTTERRVNIENIEFVPPLTGSYDSETIATINRMPNGACHGKCIAVERSRDVTHTEIIIYDRGQLVTAIYYCSNAMNYDVETIIDGWLCSWSTDGLDEHTVEPADDVMGIVSILANKDFSTRIERDGVAYCDYIAVMRDMVVQTGKRGDHSTLATVLDWGEQMPGART